MIGKSAITLAAAAMLFGPLAPTTSAAETPVKVPKIKLEPLKPGKIKLDPRLGYILVRMGPSNANDKPVIIAGRANGNATRKKLCHWFEPSVRLTSSTQIDCSRNAARASKYTYGNSTSDNMVIAPPRERTFGK